MAVPTQFNVQHKCGHTQERDLADKPAGERAGFAAWLANQPCTECWKKRQDRKLSKEVQTERAELEEHALEDQERSQLPILIGSSKQISWALRVRYELLRDAYTSLVEEGALDEDRFEADVLAPARLVTAARWWIDNRENGDMIIEILADPGQVEVGEGTENPY
ncbi:hypothetical protein [Leucobacter aridicollis]|uniref:hypothetical protein n=1 Tax=Leucobacter aridicollis TaxID=283878 RepID=UPI002104EAA5|nr:hypothetical protein [Leucobacter aridicollis]UTX53285.1 hypothetical protein KI794_00505 [Leucobacter aridicollis]